MNYLLLLVSMATLVSKPPEITSTAFSRNEFIPAKYTCEGENVNPPLRVGSIPSGTKTLDVIMDDPDANNGTFDHWLM